MAIADAVQVLMARWSQLPELLDEAARLRLSSLSADLHGATTDSARSKAWIAIVDLAIGNLPRTGVVWRELQRELNADRLAVGTERRLPLPPPAWNVRAPKPSVETWILDAPAISAVSIRRRGGDPDRPGLIRIRRSDGRVSLPRFQFTSAGEPNPLVLRINEILGADSDPWGAADWWLCPNVWLEGTPAALLHSFDARVLVAAAVVAVEG